MEKLVHQPNVTRACRVVRSEAPLESLQGLAYFAGVSAENTGSQGLCLHLVRLAPGVRANAHLHQSHETAIYMLSGEVELWYGPRLEHQLVVRAGEFLYIPADMPHQPCNNRPVEALAVVARTDPNEQESVVLLPELDGIHR